MFKKVKETLIFALAKMYGNKTIKKRISNDLGIKFEKDLLKILFKYNILLKNNNYSLQELNIKTKVNKKPFIEAKGFVYPKLDNKIKVI